MTNTLAIILFVLITGALAVDYVFFGTEHLIFLAKRMFELVDWLAFWR